LTREATPYKLGSIAGYSTLRRSNAASKPSTAQRLTEAFSAAVKARDASMPGSPEHDEPPSAPSDDELDVSHVGGSE
jgi:hypothetical protein